jgi:hypothetical protein
MLLLANRRFIHINLIAASVGSILRFFVRWFRNQDNLRFEVQMKGKTCAWHI